MNKKEQLKKELKKLLEIQQMAEDLEIDAYQLKMKGFHGSSKESYEFSAEYYEKANKQKAVLIQLINEL